MLYAETYWLKKKINIILRNILFYVNNIVNSYCNMNVFFPVRIGVWISMCSLDRINAVFKFY